jgi:hypothetical protein
MKTYILILLSLLSLKSAGQSLQPQTLGSAGQSATANGLLLEYTLGDLQVQPVSAGAFLYTPGFLQPDAGSTTLIPVINNVKIDGGAGIDNAGGFFQQGTASLEFSVGESASLSLLQGNTLLTQGLIQPYPASSIPLPVTGLELVARRLNPREVQLDWKTIQEFNNRGFDVERKLENENQFRALQWVPSQTAGGNSSFPLYYRATDINSFGGMSYYRLRQTDHDGRFQYSLVRMVSGSQESGLRLTAYPVPSSGPVQIRAEGLSAPDLLEVIDMGGRLLRRTPVRNEETIQLSGLPTGTFLIRLKGHPDMVHRIVMQ